MAIRVYSKAVTTTGSAGSATGSEVLDIEAPGFLEWIDYDFHASAPATSDVTVKTVSAPIATLATSTNSATDTRQYPRVIPVTTAGVAFTDASAKIALTSDLTVAVAQADALSACVTVYVCVSN